MARKTKKSEAAEAEIVPADEVLPSDPEAERTISEGTETIPDAEVIETTPPDEANATSEVETSGDGTKDDDTSAPDELTAPDEKPADETAMAEAVSSDAPPESSSEDVISHDEDFVRDEPDTTEPSETSPALAPVPETKVIEKRGPGFIPLVLGGLVAGGIGWAVATYGPQPTPAPVADDRIAALEAEIAGLRDASGAGTPADLSAIQEELAAQADRVETLSARLDALEGQPGAAEQTAGASTANLNATPALDAIRTDIDMVRDGLEDLRTEMAALGELPGRVDGLSTDFSDRIAALETRLGDVAQEAETAEDRAVNAAREAARNQLVLALESGQPYAEQLEILGDAPAELAAGADEGLPTFRALAGDFPDLARAALRSTRATETGGGLGSLAGRLLNARSVEPREGDDPDAILSRAEAALQLDDLSGALGELDALPPEARDVMADWISRAEMRRDAQAALQTYLQDE